VAQMPQSEFEELLNQMLKASDMLPNNPYPRANLERQIGEILLAKGRNEEAIKHLDKAMSINPKVGVKKLLYKLKGK
ncbi:MAG: tetratricopeptide repeat protein, partial [Pyrinomonadaceae bacterium]|nr:tetratricopeptide repeat protein [Pyrinomonadaceae bacterium]